MAKSTTSTTGNRRVRCVGKLAENRYRLSLARIEGREERLSQAEQEPLMPHDLINSKPISAALKVIFGAHQLSQFMDQTNPLAEITHKRRVSALIPDGIQPANTKLSKCGVAHDLRSRLPCRNARKVRTLA